MKRHDERSEHHKKGGKSDKAHHGKLAKHHERLAKEHEEIAKSHRKMGGSIKKGIHHSKRTMPAY